MKKLVMTAAVLACAASIVSAQTVTSANIVGYNKDVSPVGLHIAGMQFINGASTVVDVYGDQLPQGTVIYKYVPGAGYATSLYDEYFDAELGDFVIGWDPKDLDLSGEQGFWVQNNSVGSATAIMSGEVNIAASVTNSIVTGLQLLTMPYPVQTVIVDAGFAPAQGDVVYKYVPGAGYATSLYDEYFDADLGDFVIGWDPKDLTFEVGEGIWYSAVAPGTWIATRPFTP
jgi:hypothetical protein